MEAVQRRFLLELDDLREARRQLLARARGEARRAVLELELAFRGAEVRAEKLARAAAPSEALALAATGDRLAAELRLGYRRAYELL